MCLRPVCLFSIGVLSRAVPPCNCMSAPCQSHVSCLSSATSLLLPCFMSAQVVPDELMQAHMRQRHARTSSLNAMNITAVLSPPTSPPTAWNSGVQHEQPGLTATPPPPTSLPTAWHSSLQHEQSELEASPTAQLLTADWCTGLQADPTAGLQQPPRQEGALVEFQSQQETDSQGNRHWLGVTQAGQLLIVLEPSSQSR